MWPILVGHALACPASQQRNLAAKALMLLSSRPGAFFAAQSIDQPLDGSRHPPARRRRTRLPFLLDRRQPEVDALQTALHLPHARVGVSVGRALLIQVQSPLVIVRGPLDLVFFLRQPAHVARIPPQPVAALAVSIGQLRLLAIPQLV